MTRFLGRFQGGRSLLSPAPSTSREAYPSTTWTWCVRPSSQRGRSASGNRESTPGPRGRLEQGVLSPAPVETPRPPESRPSIPASESERRWGRRLAAQMALDTPDEALSDPVHFGEDIRGNLALDTRPERSRRPEGVIRQGGESWNHRGHCIMQSARVGIIRSAKEGPLCWIPHPLGGPIESASWRWDGGEDLLGLPMAPSFHQMEPPENPGRFSPLRCAPRSGHRCGPRLPGRPLPATIWLHGHYGSSASICVRCFPRCIRSLLPITDSDG